MPELPEVQAHAERLSVEFAGAVLEKFTPLTFTALKNVTPPPSDAHGSPLRGVARRGKYLLLDFGALTFAVHLMQGGRLKPDPKQAPKPGNGIARWRFTDGRAVLLTEAGRERKAGVWTNPVIATDGLGPEATDITAVELAALFDEHHMRLHGFLRDQHCVAGLGRRLANEVCHRAKLSPFASTGKLRLEGARVVVSAITEVVEESLAYERARSDMSSSADRPGAVHHRSGQACPVCADTVREVRYNAYSVNYCPTCQTGGKVLADNSTSKFLK
jgi:formamidopyrimidine-DNA glycosylase